MKDGNSAGVAIQTKREEKEAVSDEDEQLFWRNGLLGQSTAKSLLNRKSNVKEISIVVS